MSCDWSSGSGSSAQHHRVVDGHNARLTVGTYVKAHAGERAVRVREWAPRIVEHLSNGSGRPSVASTPISARGHRCAKCGHSDLDSGAFKSI